MSLTGSFGAMIRTDTLLDLCRLPRPPSRSFRWMQSRTISAIRIHQSINQINHSITQYESIVTVNQFNLSHYHYSSNKSNNQSTHVRSQTKCKRCWSNLEDHQLMPNSRHRKPPVNDQTLHVLLPTNFQQSWALEFKWEWPADSNQSTNQSLNLIAYYFK